MKDFTKFMADKTDQEKLKFTIGDNVFTLDNRYDKVIEATEAIKNEIGKGKAEKALEILLGKVQYSKLMKTGLSYEGIVEVFKESIAVVTGQSSDDEKKSVNPKK